MKYLLVGIVVALLAGGGAGGAWYLGLIPLGERSGPADPTVEQVLAGVTGEERTVDEEVDLEELAGSVRGGKSNGKLVEKVSTFQKREFSKYDFSKPNDLQRARKQVEIEIEEQKNATIEKDQDASAGHRQLKARYRAVSRWLDEKK
jgi:hypothetical protein